MTTADEESEVQENVVSTLNRKILTCVILVGWRVKHVEPGNMSRRMEKYIALFCYCYQLLIVSAPHPASITIKAATDFSASE